MGLCPAWRMRFGLTGRITQNQGHQPIRCIYGSPFRRDCRMNNRPFASWGILCYHSPHRLYPDNQMNLIYCEK
jgi:hypothetical protein